MTRAISESERTIEQPRLERLPKTILVVLSTLGIGAAITGLTCFGAYHNWWSRRFNHLLTPSQSIIMISVGSGIQVPLIIISQIMTKKEQTKHDSKPPEEPEKSEDASKKTNLLKTITNDDGSSINIFNHDPAIRMDPSTTHDPHPKFILTSKGTKIHLEQNDEFGQIGIVTKSGQPKIVFKSNGPDGSKFDIANRKKTSPNGCETELLSDPSKVTEPNGPAIMTTSEGCTCKIESDGSRIVTLPGVPVQLDSDLEMTQGGSTTTILPNGHIVTKTQNTTIVMQPDKTLTLSIDGWTFKKLPNGEKITYNSEGKLMKLSHDSSKYVIA